MKTLFLLFATGFAISALAWFFTWAAWIHAPQGWFGRGYSPIALAARAPHPDHPCVRQLVWYRRLKVTTIVLFLLSTVFLLLWHFSNEPSPVINGGFLD